MSSATKRFYTDLAEYYEGLFSPDPETIDQLENTAFRVAHPDNRRHDDRSRGGHSPVASPRVLDAGCGTGAHLRELLRRDIDGWGIDLSHEMVDVAIRYDPDHADRYQVADMETLAGHPAAPFDLIYSLGNTVSHLPSPRDVYTWMQTARSTLNPGGALIVQFMDVSDLSIEASIDLPQLTATTRAGQVSMERRYTRTTETTVTFDATLRNPREAPRRTSSNTLLVFSPEQIVQVLKSAGFDEINVDYHSRSRTVCATLRST